MRPCPSTSGRIPSGLKEGFFKVIRGQNYLRSALKTVCFERTSANQVLGFSGFFPFFYKNQECLKLLLVSPGVFENPWPGLCRKKEFICKCNETVESVDVGFGSLVRLLREVKLPF